MIGSRFGVCAARCCLSRSVCNSLNFSWRVLICFREVLSKLHHQPTSGSLYDDSINCEPFFNGGGDSAVRS